MLAFWILFSTAYGEPGDHDSIRKLKFIHLGDYGVNFVSQEDGIMQEQTYTTRQMFSKSATTFVKVANSEFLKSRSQFPGIKGYGGAIYVEHGELYCHTTIFDECWARSGGALAIFDCSTNIYGTNFTSCTSDIQAGAILAAGCGVFLTDAHFSDNDHQYNVYNFITISNCRIERCRSGVAGAVVLVNISDSFLIDTLIRECSATSNCGSIRLHASNLVAERNKFFENRLYRSNKQQWFKDDENKEHWEDKQGLKDDENKEHRKGKQEWFRDDENKELWNNKADNIWVTLGDYDSYSDIVMTSNEFKSHIQNQTDDYGCVLYYHDIVIGSEKVKLISIDDNFSSDKSIKCPSGVCQVNGKMLENFEPDSCSRWRESELVNNTNEYTTIADISVPSNTLPAFISNAPVDVPAKTIFTLQYGTTLVNAHEERTFAPTGTFSSSDVFSGSDSFSKSAAFSGSDSFSKSAAFSGSDSFSKSAAFSGSGSFSKSAAFSGSNAFSKSGVFSSSGSFTPHLHANIGKQDDESAESDNGMVVGIVTGCIAACVLAGIIVIIFVKKRRNSLDNFEYEEEDSAELGEIESWVKADDTDITTMRNQVQAMDDLWSDGGNFDDDFKIGKTAVYTVRGVLND